MNDDMLSGCAQEIMDLHGNPIIVHKNFGKKEYKSFKIKGIECKKKDFSKFSFFDFIEKDIKCGDIVQMEGKENLWEIVDIEEKSGFIHCKVKKRNAS